MRLNYLLCMIITVGLYSCTSPQSNTKRSTYQNNTPYNGVRKNLLVMPMSFTKESEQNYGEFIKKIKLLGTGNALWQTTEDVLYDSGRFNLTQMPKTQEKVFRQMLSARKAASLTIANKVTIPERILELNTNLFVSKKEKLTLLSVSSEKSYHVTIHLNYYNLESGIINETIPAMGNGKDSDLITATQIALENALHKLTSRLDRASKN